MNKNETKKKKRNIYKKKGVREKRKERGRV